MQKHYIHTLLLLTSLSLVFLTFGCESQGPAEKAGQNVDQSIENIKDTLSDASDKITGKGPAEKAGEKIDEAIKGN